MLPEGALVALTWSIPHQFGGLTKSLLQRSSQLATISGRPVVVITLAAQDNLDEERASLRERGLMAEGVTLVNLWENLGSADDDIWDTAAFDPEITVPQLEGPADDVAEIVRADGTVMARQRWETLGETSTLTRLGDEVVRTEIWDRGGTFLGGWHGTWPLWRWWLDLVIPRPAHMIVDSANVADCVAAAPLRDVPTTYVIHNSHVSSTREAPYGRLARWRSYTVIRAGRFDAVVHLTQAQLDHVDLLLGPQPNAHVVPHAIKIDTPDATRRRPAGRGIVMANLDQRKRVDHAVRAVAAAAQQVAGIELDIYGRGPERDAVQAEITRLSAPARLHGYTADPAGAFASSSYMLLTSKYEGFGLVLVEAMAAGSLPIAYDIEYGPGDIVNHGVDGFLVRRGDEEEMAHRIADLAGTSWWRLRRMRRAARRRAADFHPESVVPRWGPVFDAAAERARTRAEEPEPTLERVRDLERAAGLHRFLDCHLEAVITDVSWDERQVATVGVKCAIAGAGGRTGNPEIDVDLVHRPTGRREKPPAIRRIGPDPADPRPNTRFHMTIEPGTVDDADHVVLVRARLGQIDVIDTPQPEPDAPGWLPLPAPSAHRPVLIPGRRTGLRLVTARPKVAATAELEHDQVVVDVAAIGRDEQIVAVDAQGLGTTAAMKSEPIGDGRYRFTVTTPGSWKIRARANDRWRDVAWRGPEDVPTARGPVRIELSPRGYLRVARDD